MQRIVWTSDNHLDRMDIGELNEFKVHLIGLDPDGLIIAGDIAEADSVVGFLKDFDEILSCPIYFVLGNHDFWGSSFEATRASVRKMVGENPKLHWLTESGVIALNPTTALIGHEGWADARLGKIGLTGNVPRDFMMIEDLKVLKRAQFEITLNKLGDAAAEQIRRLTLEALAGYTQIYLVTHVPPFKEAALDRSGRICDDQRLPFYSCRAVGDVLTEIMNAHPESRMTVLCGHMHEKCEVDILPNLQVKVLDAGYGSWYPTGLLTV